MRTVLCVLMLGAAIAPHAAAANAPPNGADAGIQGPFGRIDGRDISVESGVTSGGAMQSSPSIFVRNGSIITVHSGHARLTFFSGGEVIICGPAKVTLLQSSDAITLALNFGRVRAKLPTKTAVRIFTPTIVATPLDIGGAERDIAVGLSLDDSLCVLATNGAIQLEHQFSGEKLIVPQAGEFFLNSGQLLPVAGTPGTCQCEDTDAPGAQPAPPVPVEHAIVVQPLNPTANAPAAQPVAAAPAVPVAPASAPPVAPAAAVAAVPPPIATPVAPAAPVASITPPAPPASAAPLPAQPVIAQIPAKSAPDFDLQVLARASGTHPLEPPENTAAPAQPPLQVPASVTIAAPMVFMASAPTPPAAPSPDMILLIREAKISSDWEFNGHVDAPQFALEVQHALGQGPAPGAPPREGSTAAAEKPRGGFWSALKHLFGGG